MIQVVYRRYDKRNVDRGGYENIAYFPNHKAALIIISLWCCDYWLYEIREVNRVTDYSNIEWHPDCVKYQHLWDGK